MATSSRTSSLLLATLLTATSLASAATHRVPAQPVTGPTACSGPSWIVHDDGTAENGIGWDPNTVSYGIYADSFDAGAATGEIVRSVCFRLGRTGTLSSFDFDVLFYLPAGLDGVGLLGGTPGTLIGSVPATVNGVPPFPGQFFQVDVSKAQVPAIGNFYTAIGYDVVASPGFFLATDHGVGSPFTDPLGSSDLGQNWDSVVNALPTIRTTMARVEQGPDPLIFADGFESGDTSSWSDTVP